MTSLIGGLPTRFWQSVLCGSTLSKGIREIVLHSFNQAENQEFVVVAHSLGSYLMFSALDLRDDPHATVHADWKAKFETLLGETSHAYFMANQVRLLELANLDDTKNGNLITHLQSWYAARQRAQQRPPQIVAWSDPDDLLTWKIPDLDRDDTGSGRKGCDRAEPPRTERVALVLAPGKPRRRPHNL